MKIAIRKKKQKSLN